ncbi:MAG: hypothetical protein R3E32_03880 [Chitinophagales bacterium]
MKQNRWEDTKVSVVVFDAPLRVSPNPSGVERTLHYLRENSQMFGKLGDVGTTPLQLLSDLSVPSVAKSFGC